jgi:hypothetical protein
MSEALATVDSASHKRNAARVEREEAELRALMEQHLGSEKTQEEDQEEATTSYRENEG